MAVRIRLRRMGVKKKPFYRLVVADARSGRNGRYIESIGFYDPRTPVLKIDEERAIYWLKVGAQPTETVLRLLSRAGVMQRFTALRTGTALSQEASLPYQPEPSTARGGEGVKGTGGVSGQGVGGES